MAGYTRQSEAGIVDGGVITASDLNNEFDQIETAMGTLGHDHSGGSGNGPKITATGLADSAVTTAKLNSSAVTEVKIASGAVTTAKLADDAVTNAKIGAAAVQSEQLASDSVATAKIIDGSVTTTKIADNAVTGAKVSIAPTDLTDVTATATEINLLDGVTATTAEINILDGVTATATEINTLDGVTASTAELNILDGVTASTAELNILDGVTATATEINLLDGITGILDEDDMASNSATALATQQSIKAYVDTNAGAGSGISDIVSDTSPQLGGDLDANGHYIAIDNRDYLYFGNPNAESVRIKSHINWSNGYDQLQILFNPGGPLSENNIYCSDAGLWLGNVANEIIIGYDSFVQRGSYSSNSLEMHRGSTSTTSSSYESGIFITTNDIQFGGPYIETRSHTRDNQDQVTNGDTLFQVYTEIDHAVVGGAYKIIIDDKTSGSEDTSHRFECMEGGTLSEVAKFSGSGLELSGSIDFGDWTITQTGTDLYFATGGTNKMKLDSSGNLTITGTLTESGTIT